MKILLHIGLPKTGTTTFQNYLAGAYSDAPRDGIWYPPFGTTRRDPSHAWFADALRRGEVDRIAQVLSEFETRSDTVLLSDENFYVETPGFEPATIAAFKDLMAPHDVTLITVIRNQVAWRRSFYLQCVEMRRSKATFGHPTANQMWQSILPYDAFFASPYAAQLQDIPALQAKIAEMVGAGRMIELRYERNRDVLSTLRDALGLTCPVQPAFGQLNPSLTDVQGEVLRQANAQKPQDGRMIRTLIMMVNGSSPRPKLLARIKLWQAEYDWNSLAYAANPPLCYSPTEFAALVLQLHKVAQSI